MFENIGGRVLLFSKLIETNLNKSIFVDECVFEEETDFKKLENLAEKLRVNNQCLWLAVSKVTSQGKPNKWILIYKSGTVINECLETTLNTSLMEE